MESGAERKEAAYWMRRLYRRGLTTATGGNVSRRAGDHRFVVTPAGIDKARVRASQVAVIALDGHTLTPDSKPSSEGRMHLRLYQRYPEIGAIIHAHPTTVCAFAAAEEPIYLGLLCETYALVDEPVTAPYALSGTEELASLVSDSAARSSSIVLRNHAVLTTGADLLQAFSRLELLEEAARVTLLTRRLDGVRRLTPDERSELDRLVGRVQP